MQVNFSAYAECHSEGASHKGVIARSGKTWKPELAVFYRGVRNIYAWV